MNEALASPSDNGHTLASLDMTDERDRSLFRRRFTDRVNQKPRWGDVDDAFKRDAVKALKVALRMALEAQDHRGINGCIKTLVLLEGQNQADELAVYRGDDQTKSPVSVTNNIVMVNGEFDRSG